jgi:transcription termination/antitermination protein NusG
LESATLNDAQLISASRTPCWSSETIDAEWYAVHVKSRHEFVVHDDLMRKRQTVFSPSVQKLSQWKDRQKLIKFPLFPGYLFVEVGSSPYAFMDVLKTRGVVAFVSLQPGRPTPILREEIEALKLMIASGKEIDIYPSLKEGTRVRMKNGPLKHAEGIISKRENQYLFVINIEILGRSLAVKLSARDIEAL